MLRAGALLITLGEPAQAPDGGVLVRAAEANVYCSFGSQKPECPLFLSDGPGIFAIAFRLGIEGRDFARHGVHGVNFHNLEDIRAAWRIRTDWCLYRNHEIAILLRGWKRRAAWH